LSWTLKEKYRLLLSREGSYHKKVWGEALNICLAYPHAYQTGMSSLGFQTVYDLFNRHPLGRCERVFLPAPDEEAEFTRGGIPLFSLESQRPLTDFDVIAFSLSFENDYPNVLKMLALGGVPLLAMDREERAPLVLGGGIAATLNPEPLTDFFDLFLLGEAEEAIGPFLDVAVAALRSRTAKEQMLLRLQREVAGAYVPRFYQVSYREKGWIGERRPLYDGLPVKIKKARLADIDSCQTEQCLTTAATELGGMHLVEVSRGCRRGCRFCAAGHVCLPVRFRKAELLRPSLLKALEGGRKIGLLGTAVSDHPDLLALCRFIRERGGKVAIGSLRLDKVEPELIRMLKEGGTETLALAPEAGSQRLRDLICKGIGEEQIERAAVLLNEQGIANLRLYFMTGLPEEEEEDIGAIIQLTERIKDLPGKRRFKRITLSINQFIPKAGTPFERCPLANVEVVKKRVRRIAAAFRRDPVVRVLHDLPKWNYIQTLLSLGDRRVGAILLAVHRSGGNWSQALREAAVVPDFYVYRQKEPAELLPWDFIA